MSRWLRPAPAATLLPPAVAPGDRVAIISPSAGAAGAYPARLATAVGHLATLGLEAVLMPHATSTGRWVSASVEDRVADLEAAFLDPDISAVLCAIGGRGATQLLGSLDYDLLAEHPTALLGYSDATALHTGIGLRTGLVTFYGPSVLMELGDHPRPFEETTASLVRTLTVAEPIGEVPALPDIVVESADWDHPHERRRRPSPIPVLLHEGRGRGPLTGGCLPTLARLVGTPWEPITAGRLLLLETPQHPYGPANAMDDLWQLRHAGLLDDLAGLVVGWPYDPAELDDLIEVLREALPPRPAYPVLVGRPFGHTSPMTTLPLGVVASLDGHRFAVEEPAVRLRTERKTN